MSDDALKFPELTKVFPAAENARPKLIQQSSFADRPRILTAISDPVRTLMLHHFLTAAGFGVVATENGADAIALLRKPDHPHVAILEDDLANPSGTMPGREVCDRMREAAKNVYLILMSENPSSKDIVSGLNTGADLYLPNAVPPEELLAYVKAGQRATSLRAEAQPKG
jgi:DNA-binding response OmpR family regulator